MSYLRTRQYPAVISSVQRMASIPVGGSAGLKEGVESLTRLLFDSNSVCPQFELKCSFLGEGGGGGCGALDLRFII